MIAFALLLAAAGLDNKITLTLRDADAVTLYGLASQVAEMPVEVDACFEGKRTPIEVKAMPVKDLLAKLDRDFGAAHVVKDGTIHVTCTSGSKGVPAQPATAAIDKPAMTREIDKPPMTREQVEAAFDALESELARIADQSLEPAGIARLLARMVEVDQGFRKLPRDQHVDRDVYGLNTRTIKAWLANIDWFTISAFGRDADHAAWLLVQHADHDVAFQRDVLARLTKLVDKNETDRSSYAYLYDRVAVNDGKLQRYATQGACTGPGKWQPKPYEDTPHVDERRAWAGIRGFPKIADYVAVMNPKCE